MDDGTRGTFELRLTDCTVVGSEELSVLGLIVGWLVAERVSSIGDPSSVDDT